MRKTPRKSVGLKSKPRISRKSCKSRRAGAKNSVKSLVALCDESVSYNSVISRLQSQMRTEANSQQIEEQNNKEDEVLDEKASTAVFKAQAGSEVAKTSNANNTDEDKNVKDTPMTKVAKQGDDSVDDSGLQKDYLNNLFSPNLLRFLSRYKFMIAIENGVCDDYITEKFWRPLVIGVIPIYFGSPSIRDWQPHNKSAIYVHDFHNAAALAAYLHELGGNVTAYNAYLNHKLNRQQTIDNPLLLNALLTRSYAMADDSMLFNKFECNMCRLMDRKFRSETPLNETTNRQYNCPLPPVHVPLQPGNVPQRAEDWRSMMAVGRCQAQLIDEFLRANRSYSEKEFFKRLDKMIHDNLCN